MSGKSLAGKTALVTGAAKRIGRAISIALADEGANIIVHYRGSEEEARELLNELARRGVKSWDVKADFEKPGEYESLIHRALDLAGGIDILVNSASIFPPEKLDEVTLAGLMTNIEVNAWAPFVLSRDFASLAGKGHIVNILDSRINDADWNHVGYILSKHVLSKMTDMMAIAYAPEIAVNAVAPGLILPPPGKDQEYIERLKNTVPLKKHGEADDIADAVVFLAKSSFITGEVIYVDGGRHLKEYSNG
ncbi:MAG: SDR family oxidoreductase [Armatimonadota bacterium]|nr:SDR family oxidoreductase [Armatimonadota bacterium]